MNKNFNSKLMCLFQFSFCAGVPTQCLISYKCMDTFRPHEPTPPSQHSYKVWHPLTRPPTPSSTVFSRHISVAIYGKVLIQTLHSEYVLISFLFRGIALLYRYRVKSGRIIRDVAVFRWLCIKFQESNVLARIYDIVWLAYFFCCQRIFGEYCFAF